MKKYILTLLFSFIATITFSQSLHDYDVAIAKLQKFYNARNYDSLFNFLSKEDKHLSNYDTLVKNLDYWYKQGKLKSFRRIGYNFHNEDNGTIVYDSSSILYKFYFEYDPLYHKKTIYPRTIAVHFDKKKKLQIGE